MKFRRSQNRKVPELNIIPMIDIMFFLLVFFMLSTMYMIDLKTIPVKLPQAANAASDTSTTFAVTLKNDGTIYLGDKETDLQSLLMQASLEQKNNSNFAVVIRYVPKKILNTVRLLSLSISLKEWALTGLGLQLTGQQNDG